MADQDSRSGDFRDSKRNNRNEGRGRNQGQRSWDRGERSERRDDRRDGRRDDRRDGRRDDRRDGRRDDRRDGRRDDRRDGRRDDRRDGRRDDRRDGRRDDRRDGRRDDRRDGRRDDRRDGRRDDRRDGRRDDRRSGRDQRPRFDNKPHTKAYKSDDPNEPIIPAGVTIEELDRAAVDALSTLSGANREIVGRHLVMAGQMIDVDPQLAYKHAQAAVQRAGRVDVVREAAALTAYATERYEEALREVRAVRRMRGDESLRAIEADSERGLGRPEKAIAVLEEADLSKVSLEEQVELVLVSAGARADLKQFDAALLLLEDALHKLSADADPEAVGRLQSYRADVLRALGRDTDADEAEALIPELPDEIDIIDIEEVLDADVDHTSTSLRGSREPLVERYDALVLDLDGVCFEGTDPIEHAAESAIAAKEQGLDLVYVTNNASRSPEQVVEKLEGFGIPAEPERVITSAINLMYLLKEEVEEGSKVLVIGTEALEDQVRKAGFEAVREAVDGVRAVVQGYGPDVGWAEMSEGALAINNGARFYATNLDSTLPTERGMMLGNGSLVAAVTRATGKRPAATGKPEPDMFLRAAEMVGAEQPLSVGDRLNTDIAGSVAARMPSLHVLTGVSNARDIVSAKKGERPTFLSLDMRGLFEPHPQPKHHRDGTWTAGVSQPVRFTKWGNPIFHDIQLRDDGDPVVLSIDNYRALAAAAWEQLDADKPLRIPELIVVPNDHPDGAVTKSNYYDEEEVEQVPEEEATEAEAVVEEVVEAEVTEEELPDDAPVEDLAVEKVADEALAETLSEEVIAEAATAEQAEAETAMAEQAVVEAEIVEQATEQGTSAEEVVADGDLPELDSPEDAEQEAAIAESADDLVEEEAELPAFEQAELAVDGPDGDGEAAEDEDV